MQLKYFEATGDEGYQKTEKRLSRIDSPGIAFAESEHLSLNPPPSLHPFRGRGKPIVYFVREGKGEGKGKGKGEGGKGRKGNLTLLRLRYSSSLPPRPSFSKHAPTLHRCFG